MLNCYTNDSNKKAIPILAIVEGEFAKWLEDQPERTKNLITTNRFLAKANSFLMIPGEDGKLEKVLLGTKDQNDFLAFGVLSCNLPENIYAIDAQAFDKKQLEQRAIAWGMGAYEFTRYKTPEKPNLAKLYCDNNYNLEHINDIVTAIYEVRDLINTPADDMCPNNLALVAENLAEEFGAEFNTISGDELRKGFPGVYAVGKGSKKQPLLIDMHYEGAANAPKIALVGKGVCFDSGGLQIKPSNAMADMKKDMGGAAHVLGLARMIMSAKLPVDLRVIVPAVENLISGDSLKPGDVFVTRQGLSIEVGHTDAEGRLILADALTLASEWKPELLLDFATLTGAARVALGDDIAALFTPDEDLAKAIIDATTDEQEPIWRLPLYQPYLENMKSKIADFSNISKSDSPMGGAITAALMLQQFVPSDIKWAHFDINASNEKPKPAMPEGGEADCLKGVFAYIKKTFCGSLPNE